MTNYEKAMVKIALHQAELKSGEVIALYAQTYPSVEALKSVCAEIQKESDALKKEIVALINAP